MLGGGVGIGFGIRAADEKSTGVMPHMKMYDASSLAYRQGKTRRGSYAAYLDISHPDILQFLEMRKPTGDPNQRCFSELGCRLAVGTDLIKQDVIFPRIENQWTK